MLADADRLRQRAERRMNENEIRIEKAEQRSEGSQLYYESVVVTGGGPWTAQPAASSTLPLAGSLWTAVLLMLASVYAFLTYRFNRNYQFSTFREDQRVKLSVLWPGLLVSPSFREKFTKIIGDQQDQKKE